MAKPSNTCSSAKQRHKGTAVMSGVFFNVRDHPDEGPTRVEFPEVKPANPQPPAININTLPLRSVVRQLLGLTPSRPSIPPERLYNSLGRFRSLAYLIRQYNARLPAAADDTSPAPDRQSNDTKETSNPDYYFFYLKRRCAELFSSFGHQIADAGVPLVVPGLQDLITWVEARFQSEITSCCAMIESGGIVFDGLGELYHPGVPVEGLTSLGGTYGIFHPVESYYDEKRSLMGMERSFHLVLEFVVSVGADGDFAVVRFEEVMSGWMGVRLRPVRELMYRPVTVAGEPSVMEAVRRRGEMYCRYASGGARYVQYQAGTFCLHRSSGGNKGGSMSRSSSSLLGTGGRMVVDTKRGSALGHHASNGFDEQTHAMMAVQGVYNRWKSQQAAGSGSSKGAGTPDTMILLASVPPELRVYCWPALVAFSFNAKCWGHVLVTGITDIDFRDGAFDQLVLPPERKHLIRALVTFGAEAECDDIIGGKSGGSVFLLHGPPGVGKTLTAEAIAETLHRPLYYVTMGELGTTPEQLEGRLGDILDLCAEWNALTLIDEADVFLEKRERSDVNRNAMLCVMLRLLEYHRGILFLTTNRVREFDPALESRITVALRYDNLDPEARTQIWKNLLDQVEKAPRAAVAIDTSLDLEALGAKYVMNGRQIKNAIRLSVALARDANRKLTQAVIEKTIHVTQLGREEMQNASAY